MTNPSVAQVVRQLLMGALIMGLAACSTAPPKGLEPVNGFDATEYAGIWYEIARLDNRFERGLESITAQYTLQADGSVKVENRGYNPEKDEWRQADGKARFRGERDIGSLEVSFFGPFYAGYHVVALAPDYSWALVAGGTDLEFFWILAREPVLPDDVKVRLLEKTKSLGVDPQRLIWVRHLARPPA
ncbi:lipocalin family protein [Hydrogenophaga sp. 5NK40-0174]|uniref:lipocalin family protein n=1 Tax=Hydrogenophaga sp. 5NK40-0174 TaxID=3127649 RepID=UPI0031080654